MAAPIERPSQECPSFQVFLQVDNCADYFMRRPFLREDAEITDEERRYFSETPLCASLDDCASHPHVEDPATIELVALVGFDHSRLYLVSARDGETKIAHRRMDGTTVAWSGHSQ